MWIAARLPRSFQGLRHLRRRGAQGIEQNGLDLRPQPASSVSRSDTARSIKAISLMLLRRHLGSAQSPGGATVAVDAKSITDPDPFHSPARSRRIEASVRSLPTTVTTCQGCHDESSRYDGPASCRAPAVERSGWSDSSKLPHLPNWGPSSRKWIRFFLAAQ